MKIKMFLDSLKDSLLYKIPNSVLERLSFYNGRIDYIFSKLKSNEKHKLTFVEFAVLFICFTVSLLCSPIVFIYLLFSIFFANKVYLHRVEVCLTTFCSLKCKNCSNLMQYYTEPNHLDEHLVKQSIQQFLDSIDFLDKIVFLGGEPFLYPQFGRILDYVLHCKKINTIQIITNGIIRVQDEDLPMLANSKVFVSVSDYGLYRNKVDDTCSIFDQYGISYERIKHMKWFDFGDLSDKHRNYNTIQKQFSDCSFKCKCIFNGKMYLCPRASHGTDLGYYRDDAFVDLLREEPPTEMRRKILDIYYRKECIEACRYCNAATDDCTEIDCGEQR